MSVHRPIIRTCLRAPRRVLVTDDTRSYTGLTILAGAWHVARALERVNRTSTVGLLIPTSGAFPIAALAGWMLGRTVVPLNYLLKPDELQFVVDDCGADTIVTVGPMLEFLGSAPRVKTLLRLDELKFRGLPPVRRSASAGPGDLAVLLYTSGTSGRPKGVMLTHGNLASNLRQVWEVAAFTRADVMLGVLPQFHSFGLTVLTLVPLTIGCRVVYTARFVPPRLVRLIRDHRPTALVAIPSMYGALLSVKDAGPDDFRSLRYVISGGEPLSDDVFTRFRDRFGVTINEGYGLTETSPIANFCLPREWRRHSVGRPMPGIDEIIADLSTGDPVATGGEGEVRIKGPNVMKGYFNRPEETAAAFDARGYFRTGDIGRLDTDGHLYITGRLKEMLIVGGENVFPREIEEVLNQHPSVHASAVIGQTDPVRGETPVAFVEAEEGHEFSETALKEWCKARLAGYKVPRSVRLVDALPRNPTGKILRRDLKNRLAADPGPA